MTFPFSIYGSWYISQNPLGVMFKDGSILMSSHLGVVGVKHPQILEY